MRRSGGGASLPDERVVSLLPARRLFGVAFLPVMARQTAKTPAVPLCKGLAGAFPIVAYDYSKVTFFASLLAIGVSKLFLGALWIVSYKVIFCSS